MPNPILDQVRASYAAVAESTLSNADAGIKAVAESFGYFAAELAAVPAEANMGLSCGNPTAMGSLRPGETVVDLGCGGGLDVFLAAAKVGPTGKVIGIDMTPSMIERARKNAAHGPDGKPCTNIEFILATIDNTTLASGIADCVISNCVINLAPDKSAVMREMFRILKPAGRLAVSDIALKQPLPEELAGNIGAYVGCIAGAVMIDEYRRLLADAGFSSITVIDSQADLNAYAQADGQGGCCSASMNTSADTPYMEKDHTRLNVVSAGCCASSAPVNAVHADIVEVLRRYDVNQYAASVKVFAIKR
ncbi:MAG: methyltransferase domain-containing protein [Phycisphaerae bacterium]